MRDPMHTAIADDLEDLLHIYPRGGEQDLAERLPGIEFGIDFVQVQPIVSHYLAD